MKKTFLSKLNFMMLIVKASLNWLGKTQGSNHSCICAQLDLDGHMPQGVIFLAVLIFSL